MSIAIEDLANIATLLAASDGANAGVQAVRTQFPRLSVTLCDASDVDMEVPILEWAHLSLYLVDGADHCWRLTDDPSRATALLIAPTVQAKVA